MAFLDWARLLIPAPLDFEQQINSLADAIEAAFARLSGYGARAIAANPQGIPHDTTTTVFFPATGWNDGSSKGTDSVIAETAGRYIITANIEMSSAAPTTGTIEASLYGPSGVIVKQGPFPLRPFLAINLSSVESLSAGDGITVRIKQTSGASVDVAANRKLTIARLR